MEVLWHPNMASIIHTWHHPWGWPKQSVKTLSPQTQKSVCSDGKYHAPPSKMLGYAPQVSIIRMRAHLVLSPYVKPTDGRVGSMVKNSAPMKDRGFTKQYRLGEGDPKQQ